MATKSLLQLDDDVDFRGANMPLSASAHSGAFFSAHHNNNNNNNNNGAPGYDAFAALDPLDDDYDSDDKNHSGRGNGGDGADDDGTNGRQRAKYAREFDSRGGARSPMGAHTFGQRREERGQLSRSRDDGDLVTSSRDRASSASCFGVAPSARAERRAFTAGNLGSTSSTDTSVQDEGESSLLGHHHPHHHSHHRHHHHHHAAESRRGTPPFASPFLPASARAQPCTSKGSALSHMTLEPASATPDHETDLREARRAYLDATEQLAERQRAYEVEREETIKKMDARHKLAVLPLHEAAAAAQDKMRAAAGALQRQFDRRIVELEADTALGREARAAQVASIERARMAALHPDDAYGRHERAAASAAMNSTIGLMSMVDSLLGGKDGVFARGAGGPMPFVRVVPLQSVVPPRQQHARHQQPPSPQRHAPPPMSAVRIEEID
nr:hypothetical protein [Pandoravirus massiliensis]